MVLKTHPSDHRYLFLEGEKGEISKLQKHLNKIPTYQLLPNYPYPPSPEVFLDQLPGRPVYYCAAGLWKEVVDFSGCNRPSNELIYTNFSLTKEQFREKIQSWNLQIQPRDYQIDAAWLILKYRLSLSELATRAGKTLIFYLVARTAKECLGVEKILMIVPSIQLVKQGVKDLQEYGEFFQGEELWGGSKDQVSVADLTIGTFQSIVLRCDPKSKKYDPGFFEHDMVVVDECHKLPCKSIKNILSRYTHLKLKFGFTGTLPKENTIEWLACQALMGPKIQEIRTEELVDEGFLAKPYITQIRIPGENHFRECATYLLSTYKVSDGKKVLRPEEDRKMTMIHEKELPLGLTPTTPETTLISMLKGKMQLLQCEQLQAMLSRKKIEYLKELVSGFEGNTIVFAHNIEYINYLAEQLNTPYKITGSTSLKKRQAIISEMTDREDMVVVAGYGVLSTGVTIKNVKQAVFAQSFKSEIVNIQAIGRGLLKQGKDIFKVYDIIDVYPTGKILSQGKEKVKTYQEHNYEYQVVNLKADGTSSRP